MAVVVRILVALEPQMYRQVLAFYLSQQRPHSEVSLASARTLRAEADLTKPHLIIANEVSTELKERGSWVEVRVVNGLIASIRANGDTTIADVSLQDFLAVVDKTEERLAHGA